MSNRENEALLEGYRRDPNNSCRWYPGAPGIPEVRTHEVHIMGDEVLLMVRPYGESRLVTTNVFPSFARFLSFARANGQISQPGSPCYSNSDI